MLFTIVMPTETFAEVATVVLENPLDYKEDNLNTSGLYFFITLEGTGYSFTMTGSHID